MSEDITEARARCMQDRMKWTRAKTKKKEKERKQRGNLVDLKNLRILEKNYKVSKNKVVKAIYKTKEKV